MLSLALIAAINAEVNGRFQHCRGVWSCTSNFQPAWQGDCKQAAALKLSKLVAAGARPDEFTIWIVRQPGGGRHAVVVQDATGLVLDLPTAAVCTSYGCSYASQVETRRLKERHEGMVFETACQRCAVSALMVAAVEMRGAR